jgi:hypothetical protein
MLSKSKYDCFSGSRRRAKKIRRHAPQEMLEIGRKFNPSGTQVDFDQREVVLHNACHYE